MALPEIILPAWLGNIIGHLPATPPRFVLVTALNSMLKRGLLPAEMDYFNGRKFGCMNRFFPLTCRKRSSKTLKKPVSSLLTVPE